MVPSTNLLKERRAILNLAKAYLTNRGNPVFSVYDNLSPIVTIEQNFDSLLIPENHSSRKKSDCFYLNRKYLLRAHTTAHQSELIRAGLNAFLVIGDVYRRDEIDKTHYPVFHQLFEKGSNITSTGRQQKQACHTLEAVKLMEHDLKSALENFVKELFGNNIKYRWVDTFFPFTQPSWELEIHHCNQWMELLGCGIMKQDILENAGAGDNIGWAFGIGLERLAMCLYNIPDIRLFWSSDTGFLNQFKTDDITAKINFKSISQYPQCINDISFWLPKDNYSNEFRHPKSGNISHCYRIVYRHMEKSLTQDEVNKIHQEIEKCASNQLKVIIR
ncbi:Aats-phe [Trypoxylus dichotomus]